MRIQFAAGAAEKIREVIRAWGIGREDVSAEIWTRLEELAEENFSHKRDELGIFGGAFIHQFRMERLPIILQASVAYDIGGSVLTILDFRSGFVTGSGSAASGPS